MTKRITIIGNGESRLGIDFNSMSDYKIGCNAAYRDFNVECVVAVDRRIILELLENNFKKVIYTREDWVLPYPNIKILPELPYNGNKRPDDPWHWGSGSHACNLAGTLNPTEIHLYGFDLWSGDLKINNVYKDTRNYNAGDHHCVDPRYWIYQMAKCFEIYSNISWIQHQPIGWKKPSEWNFSNLTITE